MFNYPCLVFGGKTHNMLRKEGKFEEADIIRKEIESKGFSTQDAKIS